MGIYSGFDSRERRCTIAFRQSWVIPYNEMTCSLCTNIILWGGNSNLIGPSGILHEVHGLVCPPGTRRVLPRRCRSGRHRRNAPCGTIPTHVCEKGGRCGCCVLRFIWRVCPAQPHSSSTSRRPIGCATSLVIALTSCRTRFRELSSRGHSE
jgi:hypothetical protein